MNPHDTTLVHASAWRPLSAHMSPEVRGMALGASAALIWGLYLVLARQGVASGLTPADIAAFRFVTAGVVMVPWFVRGWPQIRAIGLWRSLVLAFLAGPPFILLGVGGYLFAPLAHGAVIQPATVTLLSLLLATLVLGEQLSIARIVGTMIIVAGIAVIAGPGLLTGGGLTPLGDLMFVLAAVFWALFTLASRLWQVPPVAGTAIVSVLSGLVMLPVALFGRGIDGYASLPVGVLASQIVVQGLLSGVVSVIAYTRAVKLIGASRAAVFPALVPAAAIVLGVALLAEQPSVPQWTGLGLVSIGLLVAVGAVKLSRKPSR